MKKIILLIVLTIGNSIFSGDIVITSPEPVTSTLNFTPTIKGTTATPNERITLFDVFSMDGGRDSDAKGIYQVNMGETVSDDAGNFSFTPESRLTPGRHTIFAQSVADFNINSNSILLFIDANALTVAIINKYACIE